MVSIRLDTIIVETQALLERIDPPNTEYDDNCEQLIAIKGLRHLIIQLRLKNARIKELQNMFVRD